MQAGVSIDMVQLIGAILQLAIMTGSVNVKTES
jgi:hypothetical protein